jgi:hypothetical protein
VDKGGGIWLGAALSVAHRGPKSGELASCARKGTRSAPYWLARSPTEKAMARCGKSEVTNTTVLSWTTRAVGRICVLAAVILPALATTAAPRWLRWGRCCLAVVALTMAWAQTGRAQEGIAWTIKANAAVDTGGVPGFSGQRGPEPGCKGWFWRAWSMARLPSTLSAMSIPEAYLQGATSRLEC